MEQNKNTNVVLVSTQMHFNWSNKAKKIGPTLYSLRDRLYVIFYVGGLAKVRC